MHIYSQQGWEGVNYLDDLGSGEITSKAQEAFNCLQNILQALNVWQSRKKAEPPSSIMTFLGILCNSDNLTLTITPDRLAEIRALTEQWLGKDKATVRQIQEILGKLNFAASTVRAGRVFISRIINLLKEHYNDEEAFYIPEETKKDFFWWHTFFATVRRD